MSYLTVYFENRPKVPHKVLTHFTDIADTLADIGVLFERWQASAPISRDSSQEEVIAAYQPEIERLKRERGYVSVDVMSLSRNHPKKQELRAQFLQEHCHTEDEVRFFVAGKGLFMLHGKPWVYGVLCEKNDLISVPANSRHWFDMGDEPAFTAIRLFNNPAGWQAHFTGSDIASQFPPLEG